MQRFIENLDKPSREESIIYMVNGIECERNSIYKTIMDNKFYNGDVKIEKKFRFKFHNETGNFFNLRTMDESANVSASMNLDTKKFVDKFDPASEEYKSLIAKMIHAVDLFYEAEQDYGKNAHELRVAVRDCMSFLMDKISDSKAPYNDIIHESVVEIYVLLFNMIALSVSSTFKMKNASGNIQFPSLSFDTSSIKETWDEKWPDSKKSQYIRKYLSVMLDQADKLCKGWLRHKLFSDQSSRDEIKVHFDSFKTCIKSLQDKKAGYDAALLGEKPGSGWFASFFHLGHHQADAVAPASAPRAGTSPKKA